MNKHFQINKYKDRDSYKKAMYWVAIVLFLVLEINHVEKQNWGFSILILLLLVSQILKLFFPSSYFIKIFISFKSDIITYQLGEFSFKPKKINISEINNIKIFETLIILQLNNKKRLLTLSEFSNEIREQIKQEFEILGKKIETKN